MGPSAVYKASFIEAVREYQNDPMANESTRRLRALSVPDLERDFDGYVARVKSQTRGENLSQGFVPQTKYWLIDEGEFIGVLNIRHRLNEHLLQIGGHIGYNIRPSKRRQGYGTKLLELGLQKAKEMGFDRVLLTCDVTNTGSRRIIEKNGGELENQVPNPETGVDKLRFWITLS